MTTWREALTSTWAEAQMRVQAQSRAMPNVFNVGILSNAEFGREWYELVVLGRTEEALVEARRAVEIEPFSFYTDYPVWVFILARRYDLALERTLETVQARPNWVWGHYALAHIYEQTGKTDDAVQ